MLFDLFFHVDDGFTRHLALSYDDLCFFSQHGIEFIPFECINVNGVTLANVVLLIELIDEIRTVITLEITMTCTEDAIIIHRLCSAS